ncbi:MAG: nickel pincer cofactor biosynthesis protein LarC [Acidobacteria bacterium]|nr:nickel pincer cofactor biosynthesis protein LarC [Acidobacteriota bacterium]
MVAPRALEIDNPMRIAYLDCFSGISGDMFLGAVVDSGVAPELLAETVAALCVDAKLEVSRVNRSGISATKIEVIVSGEKDRPREARDLSAPEHLRHKHSHSSEGTKPHHAEPRGHAHSHAASRGLRQIREIIGRARISESVKQSALAMFDKLAWAEAKIHNLPVDEVHFHEVGAVDALVDIVGAAMSREALGVEQIVCSPLNVGGGTVVCAHGRFPVPAPATLELLKGAPVYSSGVDAELVTPTGAVIAHTLAARFDSFPEMLVEKTGYGAGTRDLPGHANVLRISVGEAMVDEGSQAAEQEITILESNLDDLNPQLFGYVMDRLLEAGALDVYATPVHMKKNRPGTMLTVLSNGERANQLAEIIFAETTTLGVRRRQERRQVLARTWKSVMTSFGALRVKVASLNGTVTGYAAEYEDCRRAAVEHRVPLKVVMQEALDQYLRSSREE